MRLLFLSQKFGARIIIEGAHIGEAKVYAETLVEKEGLTYVNGYDDPPIVAGAGTIGCEVSDPKATYLLLFFL
jgi:threonine dehydratase